MVKFNMSEYIAKQDNNGLLNVKQIIQDYCRVFYPDADGLVSPTGCGCSFDDMQSCDGFCMDCVPAKWNVEEEEFVAVTSFVWIAFQQNGKQKKKKNLLP
jgi:hypothetical protein